MTIEEQRALYKAPKPFPVGASVRLKDNFLRWFWEESGRAHSLDGKVGTVVSCGIYSSRIQFTPSPLFPDGIHTISPANMELAND